MSDILRTILIMSLSGSIVAVLLFALKPLIRDRLPKSIQYYFWLVVIAALLLPVSKLVVLTETSRLPIPTTPIINDTVTRYVVTVDEELVRASRTKAWVSGDNETANDPQDYNAANIYLSLLMPIFMIVYPLGVFILLTYYIISYIVFIRIHHRRNRYANDDEHAMLAEFYRGKQTPCLYRNPLTATPIMIGLFHPAIVLPDCEYTKEQLRAVLLHELTHLRRKDILVKWLSVIVTAIHWFNPIVWLIQHEIDRACELACDEAVIRNFDTDDKQNYGETLLYVATDAKTPHALISTTMCEEKKALKERLGAIMKSKKQTRPAIIVSAVLLVVVSGTAIVLGAGSREAIHNFNGIFINDVGVDVKAIEGVTIDLYDTGIERLTIFKAYLENADDNYVIREAFDIKDIGGIENFFGKGARGTFNENQGLKYMRYTGVNGTTATFIYVDGFDNGIENRLVRAVITPPTSDNSSPPRSWWSKLFTWSTSEETLLAENETIDPNLSELRIPYVGDNSAVGKIINILPPLGENFTQKFFSIGDNYGTGKAPNTLTLYYEQNGETDDDFTITTQIPLILFALIDNLEEVNLATRNSASGSQLDKSVYGIRYTYPRPEATDYIPDVGITWSDFQNDWENSLEKLYAQDLMNNIREKNSAWNLTLDDVRALASKGDALQYTDLPYLRPSMLSSTMGGYNPTMYGVEGGYRLLIHFNDTLNPVSGIMSTALESIWESVGSGIDIRYKDVDEFIEMHPSHPADTVPQTSYKPREWINRQNFDYSLTTTVDLMLDEFPNVLFSYTPEKLTATNKNGEKELFGGTDGFIFGGYIDNLYLADLNGDGLPEFCGTTNHGSGFGDMRVIVYDYANDKRYVLSDRGNYDYFLQIENGQLEVIQTSPMQMSDIPQGIGRIAIIDGELVLFGINRTIPSVDPQPTIPPAYSPFMSSWKPLHELPVDYDAEQAVADSVYVNIHGSQIYNQIMVDRFYADVYSGGGAAFMRVMFYTIEGDAILVDYQYDGEMFTVVHDSTRDKFGVREITTYKYKYLVADDRTVLDGHPMSYYLSNEKNIYAGVGNALIEGIWLLPSQSVQNERAPQIEVVLTMNGFSEQRIEATQLTTSWSYIDENGNSVGYEADSPHALQLDNYDDITLRLNGSNGEISFVFGSSYKPLSVSVQRWDAVYYMGQQYIESSMNQNEPMSVKGNTLRISNDGNDYIYEIYAVYEQGSSYYAFRVNAGN